jgi:hypothetical protein
MNAATKRGSLRQRLYDGRIEKRTVISVPVYVASLEEPHVRERTVTENVSPHGAGVVTERYWRSGEQMLVTTLMTGEFPQLARAVHCEARPKGRFCIGVEFHERSVKWG